MRCRSEARSSPKAGMDAFMGLAAVSPPHRLFQPELSSDLAHTQLPEQAIEATTQARETLP